MEVLIDCYFDQLFAQIEHGCLASRYKRRQLVKFFSDVINSCAEGNGLLDITFYTSISNGLVEKDYTHQRESTNTGKMFYF